LSFNINKATEKQSSIEEYRDAENHNSIVFVVSSVLKTSIFGHEMLCSKNMLAIYFSSLSHKMPKL